MFSHSLQLLVAAHTVEGGCTSRGVVPDILPVHAVQHGWGNTRHMRGHTICCDTTSRPSRLPSPHAPSLSDGCVANPEAALGLAWLFGPEVLPQLGLKHLPSARSLRRPQLLLLGLDEGGPGASEAGREGDAGAEAGTPAAKADAMRCVWPPGRLSAAQRAL